MSGRLERRRGAELSVSTTLVLELAPCVVQGGASLRRGSLLHFVLDSHVQLTSHICVEQELKSVHPLTAWGL